MPKGPTKRRPITVAALLDSAYELFADKGFGATSIGDVCSKAGLTTGAFYSNFSDKDDLFLALFNRQWERRLQALQELPSAADFGAAIAQGLLTEVLTDEPDRRWLLLSTEFSLHAIRHPDLARRLHDSESAGRAGLSQLLVAALEAAGRVPTIPISSLTQLLVAVREGLQIQALTRQSAGQPSGPAIEGGALMALLQAFTAPSADKESREAERR